MGFFDMFSGGGGPSSDQKKAWGQLSNIAGFGSSHGQNDIGLAEKWISGLLGGDRSKTSELLAPQISDLKSRGQQQIQTQSQFGNRSGGTNAANQMTQDNINSQIDRMISELTSGAIGQAANMGQSLLGIGTGAASAYGGQATEQNMMDEKLRAEAMGGLGKLAGQFLSPSINKLGDKFAGLFGG